MARLHRQDLAGSWAFSVEELGICHVVRQLSSHSWLWFEADWVICESLLTLAIGVVRQRRRLSDEVAGGQIDRVGVVGEDVTGELVVAWRVGRG